MDQNNDRKPIHNYVKLPKFYGKQIFLLKYGFIIYALSQLVMFPLLANRYFVWIENEVTIVLFFLPIITSMILMIILMINSNRKTFLLTLMLSLLVVVYDIIKFFPIDLFFPVEPNQITIRNAEELRHILFTFFSTEFIIRIGMLVLELVIIFLIFQWYIRFIPNEFIRMEDEFRLYGILSGILHFIGIVFTIYIMFLLLDSKGRSILNSILVQLAYSGVYFYYVLKAWILLSVSTRIKDLTTNLDYFQGKKKYMYKPLMKK